MSSVDVVIPCYNYARYLPQCVGSVLNQQGVEVRALIIDDCSQDDSEIVGRRLAEQHSNVEYRRHSVNRGHIATYNEGLLDWAKADYVLLLSADDMLAPKSLERSCRIMDGYPNVVLTCGRAVEFHDEYSLPILATPETSTAKLEIFTGQQFLELACRTGQNHISCPTAVVRTTIQQKIGGYASDLPHAGDMEMWMRFACHGDVAILSTWQAFYRKHDQNMSQFYLGYPLRDLRERLNAFERIFKVYEDKIFDRELLQVKYRKAVAEMAFWGSQHAFEQYDMVTFQEYLSFAVQTFPAIREWRHFSRMRWKQFIGPRIYNVLQFFLHKFSARTKS
jgi:glycosyltransferase involved in cell wall biosynthesis